MLCNGGRPRRDSEHVHVHVQLGGSGMCRCQIAFLFPCDPSQHFCIICFPLTAWCGILVEGKKVGPPFPPRLSFFLSLLCLLRCTLHFLTFWLWGEYLYPNVILDLVWLSECYLIHNLSCASVLFAY